MELLKKLEELKQDDPYPMHMPGHKRVALSFPCVYDIDITEINGYDNLHAPTGIIKKLSDEVAEMYGADHAFLSVGGSTDMNLTAIFAATRPGDKILIARNSHKSVYHAAILRNADACYAMPEIAGGEIAAEISPIEIERCFARDPDIRACVITSPTYEGVISDIEAIAGICHRHGVPLIVDAAHGAHLGFPGFGTNPIGQHADAVILSLHKTLPSLTQTGCLLINDDSLIDKERIIKYFNYFETSSPSYVLMAGIDRCVTYIREHGEKGFSDYHSRLNRLRSDLMAVPGISLFRTERYDDSKLVIRMRGRSGTEIEEILRKGKIEAEMSSLNYVICMTSLMDTKEGFDRLLEVLKRAAGEDLPDESRRPEGIYDICPKKKDRIGIAESRATKRVPIENVEGMESGAIVTVYPPGIPLIVPGEIFDRDVIKRIEEALGKGLFVEGIKDNGLEVIGSGSCL